MAAVQLHARLITSKTLTLDVNGSDTIAVLKQKVESQEEIPVDIQVFAWGGVKLEDDQIIDHYQIPNHTTLQLLIRHRNSEEQ